MKLLLCCFLVLNTLLVACQNDTPSAIPPRVPPTDVVPAEESIPTADTLMAEHQEENPTADMKAIPANSGTPSPTKPMPGIKSSPFAQHGFTEVTTLDPSIRLDIRYATTDNFTKAKIYDCPRCLLRPEAAEAIVKAHKMLQKKGLGLKMFDCYRPRPYQQRLWDKVPNADYVTPPAKGSMHSRGAAVDLTIVDANGKELDMGTPYDFFGVAAHTDHTNLPAKVLANRRLLRETLQAVGFKGIRTEWWHFSFQGKNYPLSDYVWPCDK